MNPQAAMIFAAGFGTRLGDLVTHLPKPLLTVGHMTLLDHALAQVQGADIDHCVVNAHYLSDKVVDHLADRTGVEVIVEKPNILDTGGGLLNAMPQLGRKPIFTMNSDNVWLGPNPLSLLGRVWDAEIMDILMLLVPVNRAHGYAGSGDFNLDGDQNLLKRQGDTAEFVYSGAQVIHTKTLDDEYGTRFSLNVVWDKAIRSKRIQGMVYDGDWAVVDTPYGIQSIHRLLDKLKA